MKRALILSSILLATDQIIKWFFQTNFVNKKLILFGEIGFRYITNPGIYISHNISDLSILLLQLFVLSVWILLLYSIKFYQNILGKSLLIDLSFAFLTTGLLGNLIIDRMVFGHIRDYLILPMGIANIADFCGLIAIILFSIEIILSTELRTILLGK